MLRAPSQREDFPIYTAWQVALYAILPWGEWNNEELVPFLSFCLLTELSQ